MSVSEKAVALHATCNCAQSVLCALSDYTKLDDETAKRIAKCFGQGMRCGEVCGAVSGALMAIGMACPTPDSGAITRTFKEKYGYIRCSDLLRDAKQKRCDEFIGYCAELAEKAIQEQQ